MSDTSPLSDTVGFDLLGSGLGSDIEISIKSALGDGAVFPNGNDPLSIFRKTLAASIRNIQLHPRGKLFQSFLLKGPYEGEGSIPLELHDERLTDDETTSVITFIYSFMVNSFKGAVAELLASAALVHLVQKLRRSKIFPSETRVYIGDAVMVNRRTGKGVLKGADMHILIERRHHSSLPRVILVGVAEVKSGRKPIGSIFKQLNRHVLRAKQGLQVGKTKYSDEMIRLGYGTDRRILRISIQPTDWSLPRTFRFQTNEHGRLLQMDSVVNQQNDDRITRKGKNKWHITLKWSKEAIAAAAYDMTFWYMEKVGEAIYSKDKPKGWAGMSSAEAGRNAAKMMLYYAILRCRTDRENQRAIALYNNYGFGYALGMNFVNSEGRREMLWPQDLDEILRKGKTKKGCRILGFPINKPETHNRGEKPGRTSCNIPTSRGG